MDLPSQSEPPTLALERVETGLGLARLHRVAAALFSSASEIALWTDPSQNTNPDSLLAALAAKPSLAFGCAVVQLENAPQLRWDRIHTRPTRVLAIAVRPDLIRQVSALDFGPPDAVLDEATGWALAAALALRGCHGIALTTCPTTQTVVTPESIEQLSPVGIAWLIAQSQRWARQTRTSPADNSGTRSTIPPLETGAGR